MNLPRSDRSDRLGVASHWLALILASLVLGGCVNATVDEMTYNEPTAGIGESSVVMADATPPITIPNSTSSNALVIISIRETPRLKSSMSSPSLTSYTPGSSHARHPCSPVR